MMQRIIISSPAVTTLLSDFLGCAILDDVGMPSLQDGTWASFQRVPENWLHDMVIAQRYMLRLV